MSSPAQKPRPVPVKIATSSSGSVAELGPGLGQFVRNLVVQRVQPFRPVHPHDEHLPVPFGFDDAHRRILLPVRASLWRQAALRNVRGGWMRLLRE